MKRWFGIRHIRYAFLWIVLVFGLFLLVGSLGLIALIWNPDEHLRHMQAVWDGLE
jgi:hypothetical protein